MKQSTNMMKSRPDLMVKAVKNRELERQIAAEERKDKVKSEHEICLEETRDGFIEEARIALSGAREQDMSILDPEYEKIWKCTESHMKSAKICNDMLCDSKKSRNSAIDTIGGIIKDGVLFVTDFVFKHPVMPAIKSMLRRH